MNLEEQLRAALDQEAEMRTASRPDVQALISGGRVRRRRHRVAQLATGLAAAVVLAAAGYGVAQLGGKGSGAEPLPSGDPTVTTLTPTGSVPYLEGLTLSPDQTYRLYVGPKAGGGRIEAAVKFPGQGWSSGNHPNVSEEGIYAGVAAYRALELATEGGCVRDQVLRPAATDVQRLAGQLSRLPRSTVVKPATEVEAMGYSGLHLQLRIDARCGGLGYQVAETSAGSHLVNNSDTGTFRGTVNVDFWVLDVDGTPVVVETWWQAGASGTIVGQVEQARESLTFLTKG